VNLIRSVPTSPALLSNVSRPNRYLGNALHAPRKDLSTVRVKVCLALADSYEIGMSHLGLRILHHILNRRPDAAAEFCFSPWPDAEAALRAGGGQLFSLESQRPLREFDMVGISLQYELHYTNVLNMLDLGGIPLFAHARGEDDPIVVGGGHAAFNAEPMADFFDAFVVGDGEELTERVVDEVAAWRSGECDRPGLMRRLAALPGMYVPAGYDLVPNAIGHLCPVAKEGWPTLVRSVWVESLKPEYYPDRPMVSLSEITHDRLAVEVMRGCTRGCRFCQAGMINRPVRQKAPDQIVSEVIEGLKHTGYDEVSLLSLSTTDHTEIVEAVEKITRDLCGSTPVALSLPSTRPGTLPESLARTMTEGKKPHITLAPEAGSQRMRDVINKGVCEEELLESIEIAARQGYSGAKLYFMIGLPGERPEDIVGIADLGKKALVVGKKAAHGRFTVTISISPHVPKVQTPFQWEAQDASLLIEEKVRLLRHAVKGSAVVLKWRDSETAFLEGVFSRGDRRLGAAVLEAFRRGCRFDGWTEHLRYDTWMGVFADLGIDAASYLDARSTDVAHCWEHIASPVTRRFLLKEREKALSAQVTVDCRLAFCHACGIDDCPDRLSPTGRPATTGEAQPARVHVPAPVVLYGRRPKKTPLAASLALGTRFRLRYTKGDALRFLSHLELLRVWERTLRRSGLPLAMTKGFHPHLKMAFGPPLPVGYTSIAEYVDLEFSKPPAADLEDTLNALLPPGLVVTGWRPLVFKTASLMAAVDLATYRVRFMDSFIESSGVSPQAFEDLLLEGISSLLEATTLPVRRPSADGVKEFDARPSIASLVPLAGARALDVGIRFTPRAQARPDELVRLMLPACDARLLAIERTGLYQDTGEDRLTPFDQFQSAARPQEARRATG
jgi:radical SAM family uncharacterized protein/radical SAM-linked protein